MAAAAAATHAEPRRGGVPSSAAGSTVRSLSPSSSRHGVAHVLESIGLTREETSAASEELSVHDPTSPASARAGLASPYRAQLPTTSRAGASASIMASELNRLASALRDGADVATKLAHASAEVSAGAEATRRLQSQLEAATRRWRDAEASSARLRGVERELDALRAEHAGTLAELERAREQLAQRARVYNAGLRHSSHGLRAERSRHADEEAGLARELERLREERLSLRAALKAAESRVDVLSGRLSTGARATPPRGSHADYGRGHADTAAAAATAAGAAAAGWDAGAGGRGAAGHEEGAAYGLGAAALEAAGAPGLELAAGGAPGAGGAGAHGPCSPCPAWLAGSARPPDGGGAARLADEEEEDAWGAGGGLGPAAAHAARGGGERARAESAQPPAAHRTAQPQPQPAARPPRAAVGAAPPAPATVAGAAGAGGAVRLPAAAAELPAAAVPRPARASSPLGRAPAGRAAGCGQPHGAQVGAAGASHCGAAAAMGGGGTAQRGRPGVGARAGRCGARARSPSHAPCSAACADTTPVRVRDSLQGVHCASAAMAAELEFDLSPSCPTPLASDFRRSSLLLRSAAARARGGARQHGGSAAPSPATTATPQPARAGAGWRAPHTPSLAREAWPAPPAGGASAAGARPRAAQRGGGVAEWPGQHAASSQREEASRLAAASAWVERCVGEPLTPATLLDALADGVLLCRLVNSLAGRRVCAPLAPADADAGGGGGVGVGGEYGLGVELAPAESERARALHNVSAFAEGCRLVHGVEEGSLFEPEALVDARDTAALLRALEALMARTYPDFSDEH